MPRIETCRCCPRCLHTEFNVTEWQKGVGWRSVPKLGRCEWCGQSEIKRKGEKHA